MVKWNRVAKIKDVDVSTDILGFEDLLGQDWFKDSQGNVNAHVDLPRFENGINVSINSLFAGLGQSWRPILDKGSKDEVGVLKRYMALYHKCANQDIHLMIDSVENRQEKVNEILRNKLIYNPNELAFSNVWDKVKAKFPDARGVVYGNEERSARGEMQLLFGDDIVVKDSPQVGDIVNKGIFFNLDGGIYLSYGINRLVCTNGCTTQRNLWREDFTSSLKEESIMKIRELAEWFCALPNRKVNNVRELSVVFDKFSSRVIKIYWKSWSERVELGKLTFYDVVDDVTRYANQTLGYTRQSCLNIRQNIIKLHEHKCPTCSAEIGK